MGSSSPLTRVLRVSRLSRGKRLRLSNESGLRLNDSPPTCGSSYCRPNRLFIWNPSSRFRSPKPRLKLLRGRKLVERSPTSRSPRSPRSPRSSLRSRIARSFPRPNPRSSEENASFSNPRLPKRSFPRERLPMRLNPRSNPPRIRLSRGPNPPVRGPRLNPPRPRLNPPREPKSRPPLPP